MDTLTRRCFMAGLPGMAWVPTTVAAPTGFTLNHDPIGSVLNVRDEHGVVLAYEHGTHWAIPHINPVRAPSGRNMLVQEPDPFPHHRACWIADHVQREGLPAVDFYHDWKNTRKPGKDASAGHKHFIRHDRLDLVKAHGHRVVFHAHLTWVANERESVLSDERRIAVNDLGDREVIIDLQWRLTAAYGPVKVLSDWVHYAWPYFRCLPFYSEEQGAVVSDSEGRQGVENINGAFARWVDVSRQVEDVSEGIAVMVYPDGGAHRRWLVRPYGVFGPKRVEAQSGTFHLPLDGELTGRVVVLIHRGNAQQGNVEHRMQTFVKGNP